MNMPTQTNKIYQGNCIDVLKTFPEKSIDMAITSPAYWGLRDYGVDGQLGLEPTFDLYIKHLCDIFEETKRVLKDTGTLWIVIGDSYYHNRTKDNEIQSINKNQKSGHPINIEKQKGIKPKSLVGIPFRFAIEMINRGWILRNTLIWYKNNVMPSSVKDRFTVDFEYLFFFSKQGKYYFEQQKEENGRNKRTVWNVNTKPFKEAHFAVFPEALIETPILAGCPPKGIVLDMFMGSGTTATVALKNNRSYIGIELNSEYIKIAEKRLSPYQNQKLGHNQTICGSDKRRNEV